jgi:trans-2,3-dihydro-3-hydroxyanthranilate isomerase
MNSIQYYLVDVFTDTKYGGNQLAVFVDYENKVLDTEMLAIARELNFSEITFIKNNFNDEKFEVRVFTPEYEVPFAGHPSLGTAFVISKYLISKPKKQITLALKYADIQIQLNDLKVLENCKFKMKQAQPFFYKTYNHKEIATALDLDSALFDTSKLIEEVTTGLPYIIVPVVSIKVINSIALKAAAFEDFLLKNKLHKSNNPSGLSTSFFFVTQETIASDSDFYARMFCLEQGEIMEDAATGSANGCFLAYLLKHQSKTIEATVEQGFKMGRKSHLYLNGSFIENSYDIFVSGQVVEVGSGQWKIS